MMFGNLGQEATTRNPFAASPLLGQTVLQWGVLDVLGVGCTCASVGCYHAAVLVSLRPDCVLLPRHLVLDMPVGEEVGRRV